MYEELVKRLRSVKDIWQTEEETWMLDAADAIEELQERVAASKAIIERQSDIIKAKNRDLQRAIDAKPLHTMLDRAPAIIPASEEAE